MAQYAGAIAPYALRFPAMATSRLSITRWAELHPLAGQHGLPANIVMVYGPRDADEFTVVADLVRASHAWAGKSA